MLQLAVADRLTGRVSILIWGSFIQEVALLLSVEAGSGTGTAIASTESPVLGMMTRDRIKDASTVAGEFPGAILCQCVMQPAATAHPAKTRREIPGAVVNLHGTCPYTATLKTVQVAVELHGALQRKFPASSMLPVPLNRATCG